MSCTHKGSSLSPLVAAVVTLAGNLLPHVAFASVGAGAGLPYEDTFSKFVTSLTGPWAWTVAIVCVIVFAWRAIQQGGDLGGSTTAFLGPAFICTLLLGAKKLMTFFGQGAMLATSGSTLVAVTAFAVLACAVAAIPFLLCRIIWLFFRYQRQQQQGTDQAPSAES